MPSEYLQSSDYASYGVPTATPQQVTLASAIIDGYLQRKDGLVYATDANGEACYMVALSPVVTLISVASINPGQNVNVTVTAVNAGNMIQVGYVLILDRDNLSTTEACIVTSITGNVVQLANVQFAHNPETKMEWNLTSYESRNMPPGRPITTVANFPVQKIMAAQGRYGYPRRGDTSTSSINTFNMLSVFTQFGGPPLFETVDQTFVGFNSDTGEVWIPAGIMLAYFTDIRIAYIAGYTYASLPSAIKQACANIVKAYSDFPFNGSIKGYRAGDTEIQRFGSSNIDDDTKQLLDPYSARLFV